MTRLRLWFLTLLIIFLPLSAWLVSYTGNYLVSLGRDVLLILFLLAGLLKTRYWQKPNALFWLSLIFTLFTLASYFTRQDSLAQWLRGVRYLIEPIVLFTAVIYFPHSAKAERWLTLTFIFSLFIVVVGAGIDYFYPEWLRWSLAQGGRGFLGEIHFASNLPRLQSILAGPNALGLYLMVSLLLSFIWGKLLPKWLTALLVITSFTGLVLTFSRSSYLGLIAGIIYLLVFGHKLIPNARLWLVAIFIGGIVAAFCVTHLRPDFLTRVASNNTRLEQYQRIWHERKDIGWWGRGAGTAGPFSASSFDDRPTYFSENTYLDVYENIGLLGALSYIIFWIGLIVSLTRQQTLPSMAVASAVFGLVIAGIFIDHFTGQVALWVTVLFAALLSNRSRLGTIALTTST